MVKPSNISPAESAMPWDLFIYKATLLAVIDRQYTLSYCTVVSSRVESGSDNLDNLGHLDHFFGGSSGSHPQTKLSGCDPDITCSLENNAGVW